jgi:hypothetical protein
MNTIVNHKSKDILQVSGTENPPAAWQVATAQKRRDSTMRLLGGVVSGASNRGAPRGARAQKQTDMASERPTARRAGKVQPVIRRSQQRHPKKLSSFFAGTGALNNSTGNQPATAPLTFRLQ